MENKTIDLFKTQDGWFATFYDDRDQNDNPRTYETAFTGSVDAEIVEQAISSLNPEHVIYVIGG